MSLCCSKCGKCFTSYEAFAKHICSMDGHSPHIFEVSNKSREGEFYMKVVLLGMVVAGAFLVSAPVASASESHHKTADTGTFRPAVVAHTSSFWSVMKCGVAVGAFVAGNGLLISKLRKVGGVVRVAKKLWKAKGYQRKWEVAVGFFGYASGIGALVEGCGG